jgi:hypothetical protein
MSPSGRPGQRASSIRPCWAGQSTPRLWHPGRKDHARRLRRALRIPVAGASRHRLDPAGRGDAPRRDAADRPAIGVPQHVFHAPPDGSLHDQQDYRVRFGRPAGRPIRPPARGRQGAHPPVPAQRRGLDHPGRRGAGGMGSGHPWPNCRSRPREPRSRWGWIRRSEGSLGPWPLQFIELLQRAAGRRQAGLRVSAEE